MARGAGSRLGATAVLAALWLGGCATQPAAPVPHPVSAPAPVVVPETPASAAIRAHYAEVQAGLLSEGLLRTETAPEDAPFTDRNLKENFLKIALYSEYGGGEATAKSQATPIRLTRWDMPVRVALIFGPAVPPAQVGSDRAKVASYLARLAKVTGHSIALDDENPNFWVHIATIDERAALGPALDREMPGLSPGEVASVTQMSDTAYCQVLTQSEQNLYTRAVAVIPSEHPDLLRLTCIHEELAQALGLPNDSNAARPSIFNDDQEFALLTRQDELMLKILYDPALHPGMTEAEARPIVETLATRLLDGNS